MDPSLRDEYKKRLYELTPPDGRSIGNAALRDLLKTAFPNDAFTQDDYFDLRNSLRAEGKLERGKGKGGSVHRVLSAGPEGTGGAPAVEAVEPAEPPPAAEVDLYEPFRRAVENGYVLDNDLKPWVCETTAAQGRRNTGGRWTRPDVALVAMQTFPYVPNKVFQVITFEIKPDLATALDGVFEAAAHSAFAHRSYLAFPDSEEYEDNPLFDVSAGLECTHLCRFCSQSKNRPRRGRGTYSKTVSKFLLGFRSVIAVRFGQRQKIMYRADGARLPRPSTISTVTASPIADYAIP
jgi:hypothetical protein